MPFWTFLSDWKILHIKRLCREGPSPHLYNFYAFFYSQEHFLVPDHTITDITGASFAGFYYVCLQKSAATIEGYYYHRSSEWYVVSLVVMSSVAILMWLFSSAVIHVQCSQFMWKGLTMNWIWRKLNKWTLQDYLNTTVFFLLMFTTVESRLFRMHQRR